MTDNEVNIAEALQDGFNNLGITLTELCAQHIDEAQSRHAERLQSDKKIRTSLNILSVSATAVALALTANLFFGDSQSDSTDRVNHSSATSIELDRRNFILETPIVRQAPEYKIF
jgi:hypothetical protein